MNDNLFIGSAQSSTSINLLPRAMEENAGDILLTIFLQKDIGDNGQQVQASSVLTLYNILYNRIQN
jgi:hypothetical protein